MIGDTFLYRRDYEIIGDYVLNCRFTEDVSFFWIWLEHEIVIKFYVPITCKDVLLLSNGIRCWTGMNGILLNGKLTKLWKFFCFSVSI